ncbi:hypothetical protein DH2020_006129 [Rehmannia glutinosa]|uniref:Uncharacterized protein n=1 Tax=Rehmannia glutinosa TaxID=99300 RepID=A0ABR0XHZ6_REHGL
MNRVNLLPKGSNNVETEGAMFMVKAMEGEFERASSIGGKSTMSFSSGILPPLGAQSNRKVKLRPFIVSPFDPRYRLYLVQFCRTWETFLVVLVFYTAWVSPFEFGFLRGPKGPLSITDNVVNGFFAIDIVLTFFVAYLDKSTYLLIDTPKLISLRYAKRGLVFDVISTIPSELVRKVLPSKTESYDYFSMLRLWRLKRVSAMFQRRVPYLKMWYKDPKRTWIGLTVENFHEEPVWDKYFMSIYWSIITATMIGYGDFHPVNTGEMIFDFFYLLFVLGLASYIIGNMTNLIVQATFRTRKFRDTINAASSFAKRNQLPSHLHDQMIAHLSLKYRTDSEGLQQQETLDALPKAIRSSISDYLFYSLVNKVYLFQGVSNDLLFQLVSEMRPEYFPLREDIILENEAPTDLYILVIGELKTGDVCGEVGVLCYRPQLFTVRTKRLSQLLRLNRTALFNILQANVGDATIIMDNLLEHLKEYTDPMMQEILTYTEHMLAHGRMDMPLSLCFAAARGYDLLLHHLLRRGLDPNELDSNGRNALHLATSKGYLECVLLLLDYGANPNEKGTVLLFIFTFLWKRSTMGCNIGKHESVIKVLVDNGATLSSGDVGGFACFATKQNDIDLLKEIIKFGGDVTLPNCLGTTALHTAISEGNVEIVKFLIEQGADIDKADEDGCTPRALANHLGYEEIQALFQTKQESEYQNRHQGGESLKPEVQEAPYFRKYSNGSSITLNSRELSLSNNRLRRRPSNFQNSLVGIIKAGQKQNEGGKAMFPPYRGTSQNRARVTVSCPERGDTAGKLVLLPGSLRELMDLGYQKFGFRPTKIVTKSGYLVEDFAVIRDGDHLILASEGESEISASK